MKKRTLLIATLSALLFTSGWAASAPAYTVMDALSHSPKLTTAARLIQDAGLADTLQGPGPVTIFAPSNEAFAALPAAKLAEITNDKEALKAVLGYHIVPASITLDTVVNGKQKTVSGDSLTLYKSGSFLTVESAVVIQADVKAANGMIQVIDTVLMPPKK
jgi:uncharacterized surface protein with fasciclin (FAS1) repeats